MFKQFKEFAFKGNLVDMAVGIIIGGAFATVVQSLVSDVIMPAVGALIGDIDFTKMKHVITPGIDAVKDADGNVTTAAIEEVAIKYGSFLTELISFIILAFVVFILIKKVMGAMQKQEEEATPEPPKQEVLLEEIRDALKK
jgi:large conductance mechanosensitive channel